METTAITTVLAIGSVLVVVILVAKEIAEALYTHLYWPSWLVRHFDKQRAVEFRGVLDALGLRDSDRRLVRHAGLQDRLRQNRSQIGDTETERIYRILRTAVHHGEFSVGRRHPTEMRYYVDLFSASLDPMIADECAQLMLAKLHASAGEYSFTKVVGLKSGSPMLAAAVAQRLDMPLILHRSKDDAKPYNVGSHARLDGEVIAGDNILLVDDSSTGGRMVRECIETIRDTGASVTHVLVFFEPIGKDGRGVIQGAGADFISVVAMTDEAISRLRPE